MITANFECIACRQTLPETAFHKDRKNSHRNGRAYRCAVCATAYARQWHSTRKNDPEYRQRERERHYKTRWGMSLKERAEKLAGQDWKCAICRHVIDDSAHQDHDHETGELRKLLCGHCNRGLGSFYDSVQLLQQAISYLEEHKANPKKEFIP